MKLFFSIRRQFSVGAAAIATVCLLSAWNSATAEELPAFSKVDNVVRRHFESLSGHQEGDLISQTQVKPIFGAIELLGWTVSDSASIKNSVLPDSNYLVEQFRTPKGKAFMRKVSASPLAYDRLDQICRLPNGKLMINDFLRFPNAEVTFTNKSPLAVSRLERLQPTNRRNGQDKTDLDQPTGRIYTVDALVARLKGSYNAEVIRRKKLAQR